MRLPEPAAVRSVLANARVRLVAIIRRRPWWALGLLTFSTAILLFGIGLYVHFSRLLNRFMDARTGGELAGGPAVILASPRQVWVGQEATAASLAAHLRNALYTEGDKGSEVGTFALKGDALEIRPGKASYFHHGQLWEDSAEIKFRNGHINSIQSLKDQSALQNYRLEPEVITTLSGYERSERRLLRYSEIPKVLVDAVIAAEDHDFFSHHGVNPIRLVGAAMADMRRTGPLQGGSTLTMQLARNLFLTPRRTLSRKAEEICLAEFLENRLTKQQIFELYANRVYLGQQGHFGIFGFGDAAQAYFNKDVSKITLPEAAYLAGLIRGPNIYTAYKYPDRALERRASVLKQMVQTGTIKQAEAEQAMSAPLNTARPAPPEGKQEAYFEDMVTEQLRTQFTESELRFDGLRVYTTLDMDIQQSALDGARIGSVELDRNVKSRTAPKDLPKMGTDEPQYSLVVMDPHTGDLKALIGGRDYGASQLNHARARRQPGSSFKPFVFAAALSSAVDGSTPVITPATLLNDEPAQFKYGNDGDQLYAPRDFMQDYHGEVTVRQALVESLNVPAVRLAQTVGYDKVRNLAIAAGFNSQIEATPSIALGSYVATPIEVAGAYTIFANQGQYVSPRCIIEVEDSSGTTLWMGPVTTRRVLDERVSYLMVTLLQGVINNGTGYGVRERGFRNPAGGKTGTSHDGWFAGFTSNLLAVAWVGYDDDTELNLTGSQSALPIWTEFMKRAMDQPAYRNPGPFAPPPGVVTVPIQVPDLSADSDELVKTQYETFIQGTAPPQTENLDEPPDGVALAQEEAIQELPDNPQRQGLTAVVAQPINQVIESQTPMPAQRESSPATKPAESGDAPRSARVSISGTPEEKTAVGELNVQTDPAGLEVSVDGRPAGLSPVTLRLPAGKHTYKINPPSGGTQIERTLEIKTATTYTVKVHY